MYKRNNYAWFERFFFFIFTFIPRGWGQLLWFRWLKKNILKNNLCGGAVYIITVVGRPIIGKRHSVYIPTWKHLRYDLYLTARTQRPFNWYVGKYKIISVRRTESIFVGGRFICRTPKGEARRVYTMSEDLYSSPSTRNGIATVDGLKDIRTSFDPNVLWLIVFF